MSSATVTELSNPRDVTSSLREIFDSHAAEAYVEAREVTTGGFVTSVDHTHSLLMAQSLTQRAVFGRGPYHYDMVNFRGTRFLRQDEVVPLWEHYSLSISDDGLSVASVSFDVSRIFDPESQEFGLNGSKFTRTGGVPNVLELEAYRRTLPVIRVALLIGEAALIKTAPEIS